VRVRRLISRAIKAWDSASLAWKMSIVLVALTVLAAVAFAAWIVLFER
jgi:hypothetical protein